MNLASIAYNLKRMMNVLGGQKLPPHSVTEYDIVTQRLRQLRQNKRTALLRGERRSLTLSRGPVS